MSTEKIPIEDDYNPFEHRKVTKPSSDIRAFANVLKSSLGSGLLAIPLAFSNAGWLVGIVGTIVIAAFCCHCVYIFVQASHEVCRLERKPCLSYSQTVEATFNNGPKRVRPYAKTAKLFADFSLFCTYVGVACIFTVLIADSIKQLFDRYVDIGIIQVEYYCLAIMVPLCLLCQIRYLKWLAPISLLANVLLFATFAICLYYIFGDSISFEGRQIVAATARFPAFLSTVIFAMEGIGVIMPVENAMKKPQHFLGCPGVLVMAMAAVTILYSILGFFGYLRYGNALRGSITLNLPLDDWPAICAKIFIAFSILLTYPLHFYVVIDTFTRYTEPHIKEEYRNIVQIVSRAGFVIFCGCIGVALPMLEQITNLVGALFYSILGLIIPGIVDSVFRWQNPGRFNWILWKNLFIVLFGFGALLAGCSVTIMDIIARLHEKTA